MAWKPHQVITVTTAGTPVQVLTTNQACHAIMIEVLWTNTGRMYIGDSTLNVSTKTGLMAVLPAPTSAVTGPFPAVSAGIPDTPNSLNLKDLWVDAAVNGESVIISVLEA